MITLVGVVLSAFALLVQVGSSRPPLQPIGTIVIDTGDVEAIPFDLLGFVPGGLFAGAKRMRVESIPAWATSVHVDATLSGRAWVDLENTSDTPIWGEGSLTVRYDRWHDGNGWWNWFPRNAGAQFVVTEANPIPPHSTRSVLLIWSESIFPFDDPAVWGWRDKWDWFLADCYYPVIIRVRNQMVDPQQPDQAHALGFWATVGGEYENGIHNYPPITRAVIRAEYQ